MSKRNPEVCAPKRRLTQYEGNVTTRGYFSCDVKHEAETEVFNTKVSLKVKGIKTSHQPLKYTSQNEIHFEMSMMNDTDAMNKLHELVIRIPEIAPYK